MEGSLTLAICEPWTGFTSVGSVTVMNFILAPMLAHLRMHTSSSTLNVCDMVQPLFQLFAMWSFGVVLSVSQETRTKEADLGN